MLKKTYNPRDGEYNRTFPGFNVILPTGYEITGLPIIMQVKQKGNNTPLASYSVGNGIDVLSSLSFRFNPGVLSIIPGVYNYDILIQYPSNAVSWISGIWTINETVSRTV